MSLEKRSKMQAYMSDIAARLLGKLYSLRSEYLSLV